MKYAIILLAFFASMPLFAQDSAAVTDEELKKYAVLMDSVEDMKASLLEEITTMVKSNEKITNARYNELSKIIDDEAKLAAAKATPEEVNFIKEVQAKKEEGTTEITETFQKMAKEYVGAEPYNKIKKALSTDPSLKSRYTAMLDEVKKGESVDN
jgi:predicted  nucleic acid-binding Zn-ribbon protein